MPEHFHPRDASRAKLEALLEEIEHRKHANRTFGRGDAAHLPDGAGPFIDTLPRRLAACRDLLDREDYEKLRVSIRHLKGSARLYGFEPIARAADHLEALAEATSRSAVAEDHANGGPLAGHFDARVLKQRLRDGMHALALTAVRPSGL